VEDAFMDISKGTRTALGLVGAVMLILTVVAVSIAKSDGIPPEAQLPLIAIMGVATMLAVLTLMALAFSSYNLADRGQALGLPEGSIRAVIALSLIIIFAVVSIFLFSSLREMEGEQKCCLPPSAKNDTAETSTAPTMPNAASAATKTDTTASAATASAATASAATASPGTPATTTDTAGSVIANMKALSDARAAESQKAAEESKGRDAIAAAERKRRPAEDFARELLILLGTLITSVSSFYFGSRAAASETRTTAPKIDGITPPSNVTTADVVVPVTIRGTGLLLVNAVTLRSGTTDVSATDVVSSESQVQCKLPLTTAMKGKWDVVVTTRDGGEAQLKAAFEVT
jgi:hypothetical protein